MKQTNAKIRKLKMRLPRFLKGMHPMMILTLIAIVVILIELFGGQFFNFLFPILRRMFGNA